MTLKGPKFKTFDVRSIIAKGLEPFPEIRARIDKLRPGEGLSVVAPFLPSPLIERLRAEGFHSRVERDGTSWITHFWRDDAAEDV
jgi:uncharacterized protein (DUF2249 family)